MLNVDWFQPFKRRSVGVIYFVIMNLPRSERFKFENVILGGIIPSLESEPKLHTFLEPCVDELNGLWKGVQMSTSLSPVPLRVVAALLCVAADIPATRKVCGFVGNLRSCPLPISPLCLSRAKEAKKQKKKKKTITPDLRLLCGALCKQSLLKVFEFFPWFVFKKRRTFQDSKEVLCGPRGMEWVTKETVKTQSC